VTTLAPRTAAEVADAIRWALAAGEPLEVLAGGTRRGLGRPVDAPHTLDVSALSGIVSYEPEELVLSALPGTSLAEIEALLASRKQCLAFEPPYLFPGRATLGGAIATAGSGPRRPRAGAVRDHVLGVAAVSGRGEFFVGGGKVVKNVTGYDMPKLLTGSYGTLAVLTEITVKVLPAPEDTRTLLVHGLTPARAVQMMTSVSQSTADTSGACHVPLGLPMPGIDPAQSVTALRLEGVTPSVEFRLTLLKESLVELGSLTVLDREASIAFWRALRDVAPLAGGGERHLWRLSVPPASGADVLDRMQRTFPRARVLLDWGGGLIWLEPNVSAETSTPSAALSEAQAVRAALGETGGHATLIRGSAEVRQAIEVFQPQPAALSALSTRVKSQFDPKQILNPGRMYAGL
jgi:glycolate oxidase FAD binding subunit